MNPLNLVDEERSLLLIKIGEDHAHFRIIAGSFELKMIDERDNRDHMIPQLENAAHGCMRFWELCDRLARENFANLRDIDAECTATGCEDEYFELIGPAFEENFFF
jgi:hypothetical protein